MPTVRLNNGNIEADGSLIAQSVTTQEIRANNLNMTGQLTASGDITLDGDVNVQGDVTAQNMTITSGISVLSVDCNQLQVQNVLESSGIDALTVNVKDTLSISGDLNVSGDDDRVLGDTITDVTGNTGLLSLAMRHNYWYNAGPTSYINILADTNSGRIKTCYIISSPATPLVMNGVQWLWEPVELEDTSKTHVVALQQIGAGPVMANVAYSY